MEEYKIEFTMLKPMSRHRGGEQSEQTNGGFEEQGISKVRGWNKAGLTTQQEKKKGIIWIRGQV